MSNAAAVFARWRVRLGYILAVFVLWFARPTPECVGIGAAITAGTAASAPRFLPGCGGVRCTLLRDYAEEPGG